MTRHAAELIVGPCILAAYLAFGIYGMRLEYKLLHLRIQAPPRNERWNPQYYQPEAAPLLRRDRYWRRMQVPVWLGSILLLDWLPTLLS